jgi:DNA-binding CsgD family transcriptional regulator
MTKSMIIPDQDYLPPELLLDVHHPANADYMKNINSIKRTIVSQSMKMAPKHVDIVKRKIAGALNKTIALELNVSPQTIGKTLKRKDAQQLRALLEHFNLAVDGPNDAHRRRMLWEIAVDNQPIEPKVSISAIVEINKMNGTYNTAAKDTAINITINNTLLPKGKLDT